MLTGLLAYRGPAAASPRESAESILEEMTPDERVGQLFLVTFQGVPQPGDRVFDLITRQHVAGVILRASNDNFIDSPGTLAAARGLIAGLQSSRYASSREAATPAPGETEAGPPYIPLFVGLSMDRDGKAVPEILEGLSEIPTQMAIGGTWSSAQARRVGGAYGSELSALGVNLLLGPSLDVIEAPQAGRSGDPGVLSFGGDPFWAGLLGRSFIEGVQQSSGGSIAIIAKHFPGLGGSDRPIEEEVATIRKSLDELQQVDLAPFFTVTSGRPGEEEGVTDGLLTSHIRYQGLQGNIRATTRPVSLDGQALGQILSLQSLPDWRAAGGLMVSDALGTRALRRFYDPSEQTFNGSLAAKDAFLAGNDLLILDHFLSTGDADEYASVVAAISAFVTRYGDDPAFAERVDASVLRILTLKLRLYGGSFPEGGAVPGEVAEISGGSELAFSVASLAASLISPSELETLLPPSTGQRIVFFTDVRQLAQCSTCTPRGWMEQRGLETAVLDLYGPGAAGQVGGWNLISYTMADLARALGERPPAVTRLPLSPAEDVTAALEAADWLVFSIQSTREGVYGSNALKLLLDQRPDLARSKRVVVFAHDVPYELDATDISKLDAYYALYGASESFVSLAARLLFQEVPSPGDPPVSVPGIGYDLIRALSPDPAQKISLLAFSEAPGAARVTPETGFARGDLVYVETSPILDHNGRAVPDGTPVEFLLSYQGESLVPIVEATTVGGVAQVEVRLDRTALISVQARSDLARVSDILQLDVQEGQPAFVTVIAPSPAPSATTEATGTSSSTTPTPGGTDGVEGEVASGNAPLGGAGIFLAMVVLGGMGALGYQAGRSLDPMPRGAVRYGLLAAIGALAAYDYAAIRLPGSAVFRTAGGLWWLAALMVAGGAAGVAVARWWQTRRSAG
jgi:beta-N-acetylhexosaminidase